MDTQLPGVAVKTRTATGSTVTAALMLAVGSVAVSFAYAIFAGVQAQQLIPQRQVYRMAVAAPAAADGQSTEVFSVAEPVTYYGDKPSMSLKNNLFVYSLTTNPYEPSYQLIRGVKMYYDPPTSQNLLEFPSSIVLTVHAAGWGGPWLSDRDLVWNDYRSPLSASFNRPPLMGASLDKLRTFDTSAPFQVLPEGYGQVVGFNKDYLIIQRDNNEYWGWDLESDRTNDLADATGIPMDFIAKGGSNATLSNKYFTWVSLSAPTQRLFYSKPVDRLFSNDAQLITAPAPSDIDFFNVHSYGSWVVYGSSLHNAPLPGGGSTDEYQQLVLMDIEHPDQSRVLRDVRGSGGAILAANISRQYVVWIERVVGVRTMYALATADLADPSKAFPVAVGALGNYDWGRQLAIEENVVVFLDLGSSLYGGTRSVKAVRLPARFVRGDADGDGALTISDPVATLRRLFQGGPVLECLDAADGNDDGEINLADAQMTLNYLFSDSGQVPPAPGPIKAGVDPTADEIGCGWHPE